MFPKLLTSPSYNDFPQNLQASWNLLGSTLSEEQLVRYSSFVEIQIVRSPGFIEEWSKYLKLLPIRPKVYSWQIEVATGFSLLLCHGSLILYFNSYLNRFKPPGCTRPAPVDMEPFCGAPSVPCVTFYVDNNTGQLWSLWYKDLCDFFK